MEKTQYKAGQGTLARLVTLVSVVVLLFMGVIELYSWIQAKTDQPLVSIDVFKSLPVLGVPFSWKFLLCCAVFVGGLWGLLKVLRKPATVDALIETEAELKKVSWPTPTESWNASLIVILVTLILTGLLWLFDIAIQKVLQFIF